MNTPSGFRTSRGSTLRRALALGSICLLGSIFLMILCACRQKHARDLRPDDLVDVRHSLPDAVFDLRYATTNNFTHRQVYPQAVCLLRRSTFEKLRAASEDFKTQGLQLKIFDCYRPLSVQRQFWALVPDERYVADPAKGSRHNRGAAVDLTLAHRQSGEELEMGTGFDDFSERAHRDYRGLPEQCLGNRKLFEDGMMRHGFTGLPTEWWHFDDDDWAKYPVSDQPLSGNF